MREWTLHRKGLGDLKAIEAGRPEGFPVFVLHGTPGCRLLYEPFVRDAARKGLRLISYDRPGYGGSTPVQGRRIIDSAADVAAIADDLGVEKFGVWGFSGGGAPALACAAALPERVVGAASLAGVAPYPAEGLDWSAGAGEANREDFELLIRDPVAWEAKSEKEVLAMREVRAEDIATIFATLLSPVDVQSLKPEVSEFLAAQAREGLRASSRGIIEDSLSDTRPWGFDLSAIRVPTQLWHGGEDKFVPFAHATWLAPRIPGVEAHLDPSAGHLSTIFGHAPDVQSWLAMKF